MKREDLQAIEGLTDDQINNIMNLHQKDVTDWNKRLNDQKEEITKRDTTISDLSEKVKKFDGVDVEKLQNDIRDMEEKHKKELAAKDRDYAKKLYFDKLPFASNLARQAAMAEFDTKDFKFENGKFLGADDYIAELKKSDPSAFKTDEPNGPTGIQISTGMEHGGSTGKDDDLDGVTKKFMELNPDIKL